MTFRLSRKLATKIKAGKLSPLPPAEDPLTDWSGHLFVADRVQYILLSHTGSLYSTVMYGRGDRPGRDRLDERTGAPGEEFAGRG